MADVDPFLLPIPKALQNDPETRNFFEYFVRWAHDMWIRTGGGSDQIASQSLRELYPWVSVPNADEIASQQINGLFLRQQIDVREFNVISVTGTSHTTAGNEILICSNAALLTVTFNATPAQQEQVIVVRNGAPIKVTSTKEINGKTTKRISRKYTAIHHIFTTEADAWNTI